METWKNSEKVRARLKGYKKHLPTKKVKWKD